MFKGPVDDTTAPRRDTLAVCCPLTSTRSVVPSETAATCDHVFSASGVPPVAVRSAVVCACADGPLAPVSE